MTTLRLLGLEDARPEDPTSSGIALVSLYSICKSVFLEKLRRIFNYNTRWGKQKLAVNYIIPSLCILV